MCYPGIKSFFSFLSYAPYIKLLPVTLSKTLPKGRYIPSVFPPVYGKTYALKAFPVLFPNNDFIIKKKKNILTDDFFIDTTGFKPLMVAKTLIEGAFRKLEWYLLRLIKNAHPTEFWQDVRFLWNQFFCSDHKLFVQPRNTGSPVSLSMIP